MGYSDHHTSALADLKLVDNVPMNKTTEQLQQSEEDRLIDSFDDLDLEAGVRGFYDLTLEQERALLGDSSQDSSDGLPVLSVEQLDEGLASMIKDIDDQKEKRKAHL